MKLFRFFGLLCPALLAVAFVSCSAGHIPPPTGSYSVGTTLIDLVDHQRMEPNPGHGNDPRRIVVRVWYPAASTEGSHRITVVTTPQVDVLEKYMGFPRSMAEGNLSLSWENAPPIKGKNWPIVIFNHGSFSFETQNFVQMQDLASNGYVVFATNHPYESLISQFADGSMVYTDETIFKAKMAYQKQHMEEIGINIDAVINKIHAAPDTAGKQRGLLELATIEPYAGFRQALEIRVADDLFLRDSLDGLNRDSLLSGTMDTAKVALMGHSLGGISAVETMLRYPQKFTAAVNLDGPQLLWDPLRDITLRKPVLFMHSTAMRFGSHTINMLGVNAAFVDSAAAPVYEAGIAGMGHFNYCDLTFIPILGVIGMLGPIQGERAGVLYSAAARGFLDKYLKGASDGFPDRLPVEWPEVSLRSRKTEIAAP